MMIPKYSVLVAQEDLTEKEDPLVSILSLLREWGEEEPRITDIPKSKTAGISATFVHLNKEKTPSRCQSRRAPVSLIQ